MTYAVTCPHCRTVLKSKVAIPSGQKVKCLKCANTFRTDVKEEPSAPAAVPKGAGPVIPPLDDDLLVDEDLPTAVAAGAPPAKARKDDERARSSRQDEDDEEDYRPRSRKRPRDDEEEPPRAKRPRVDEDDEEDYRPRSRRREEEDEDDRPRSRRSRDDEDDDRPRRKKKKQSSGNTVLYVVLGSILGVFLLCGGAVGLFVWRVRTAVQDFGKMIDEAKKGPGMIGEVINDAQAPAIQVTLDKEGRYHNANQLTQADAKAKERPYKVYKLDMQAGRVYSIEMSSNSIDAFLRLVDANGNVLASDDDGAGDLNSRIVYQCHANGTYRIHATYLTTKGQPAPWNYDVLVAMLPEGAQVPQRRGGRFRGGPPGGPPLGKLTKVTLQAKGVQSFAGALHQGDARFQNMPHHVFEVALQKGKTYQIDMTSQQFDTFLFVLDAANQVLLEDDDSGGDLNARVVFSPPADATYKILASSLNGTGNYTLTITPQ